MMEQAALALLSPWESFYVIMGSSAAALTGLQFVVIVLSAEMNSLGSSSTVGVFGTPTIVHFCVVLLLSAILSAPWPALSSVGLALGACGVAGLVYALLVARNARRQTGYVPMLEDWIWHCALPLIAYIALLAAAILLQSNPASCLFVVGATAILLLFIGIHNSWDSVVYIALHHGRQPAGRVDQAEGSDERPQQPEC